MTKTYKEWYQSLSLIKQLCISFALNIAFWFISSLIFDIFIWNQDRPIQHFAFRALFMAFFWTIIFNWSKIKEIFSRDKVQS